MKSSKTKSMGFFAVLLSGFFLFNPVVAFVDILPNCIGYLLLCLGLSHLADLNGSVFEALRRFRILFFFSIAQLLAAYFAYGIIRPQATNIYELRSYIMLGSFLMLLAQWLLLVPALRDLFRGIDYLADRYGASSLLTVKKGRTVLDRTARRTRNFVILSSSLALLPELSAFSSLDGAGESSTPFFGIEWYSSAISSSGQAFDRYTYIDIFRVLCATVSFAIALVWLISFIRFIRCILREKEWLDTLDAHYQSEVLPQTGMLTVRRFSASFYLLQIGILFVANLRMNDHAILPGAVFALFVLFALLRLGDLTRKCKGCYAVCMILTIVSVAFSVTNTLYLKKYLPMESLYQADAYTFYWAARILEVAEIVLTLLLTVFLLQTLSRIVRQHTAVEYTGEDTVAISHAATKKLYRWFDVRLSVTFVIFTLAALANIIDIIFRLEYPQIWWIAFVLSFAGIWSFYSVIYELKTQIVFTYQSDCMNKNI